MAVSDCCSTVNSILLPVELLSRIGIEVLRIPQPTSMKEFGQLRLVCKLFDQVFAPIVLSSITVHHVYHDNSLATTTTPDCERLLSLIDGTGYASYAKELVLTTRSHREAATPSNEGRPQEPTIMLKAKEYIECIDQVSFNLPNVHTVTWRIDGQPYLNTEKSMRVSLRLLETLPSLLQLNLCVQDDIYLGTSVSLPTIRNLQKLQVLIKYTGRVQRGSSFMWLKDFVTGCPNLTHLAIHCIHPSTSISLSTLFEDVPADCPLKLQHLRVCGLCYDMTPRVLSHLRSLTSLHVSQPTISNQIHEIWQILIDERIFVSKLSTKIFSNDMLRYISHLDKLTHFSIESPHTGTSAQVIAQSLFQELAKHSSTLTHLELSPFDWNYWYYNPISKLSFLQCTRLEQLALAADTFMRWHNVIPVMECISQTEAPLTVVVNAEALQVFDRIVYCCRRCGIREVQQLAQQMVYMNDNSPWDML